MTAGRRPLQSLDFGRTGEGSSPLFIDRDAMGGTAPPCSKARGSGCPPAKSTVSTALKGINHAFSPLELALELTHFAREMSG